MEQIEFAHIHFLWLLLLLPLFVFLYVSKNTRTEATIAASGEEGLKGGGGFKVILKHINFGLKLLAFTTMIVALARPQSSSSFQNVSTEGIDIILAMDVSTSMLARDLRPDRLEASKKVAQTFIKERINDRIGLVVYAGESFTQCPLTTDKSVVVNLMKDVENGLIQDGTAIGLGLATAISRLKESKSKSKVVILLTDGTNNSGDIPPVTAAEIAQTFGIRVYTIGLGTNGMAEMPVQLPTGQTVFERVKVQFDEVTLKEIAKLTGGKYFRATDNTSLKNIYAEIDKLEKTKTEVTEFRKRKEEFRPWLFIALGALLLQFLIAKTVLKSIV